MRALITGSGAREHALAWKISQSPLLEKLYLWGANDGFCELGEIIEAKNIQELAKIAATKKIDIAIVGPENQLAEGIVDILQDAGIFCIGTNKFWTQLESSKLFAKKFMQKYDIKTAKYEIITDNNIPKIPFPVVLKADGLCGGKGVIIAKTETETKKIIAEYLGGKFGEASKTIIAEEFLDGEEISLISLFDGKTLLPFIPARDFKKLENGDKGPNTGGMGAYCPIKLTENQKLKLESFIKTLENSLLTENADFTGIIYSGLIWAQDDFYLLEFNMRFGDPETQALMMHLESDLLELFGLCIKRKLHKAKLQWKKGISGCLTIATKGYPEKFPRDTSIGKIPDEVQTFFAGVKKTPELKSNGGRVLSLCYTSEQPYDKIYESAEKLEFKDKFYRTDIKC